MSEADCSTLSTQILAEACAQHMYNNDKASQGLGIRLEHIEPGRAVMTMPIREDMLNGHACCHGGFIFALADSTFAFACNSRNQSTLAQGCSIDYLSPGKLGEVLTAEAQTRHQTGRTGVYDVTVSNDQQQTIALFRGKSYRIKGSVLPAQENE